MKRIPLAASFCLLLLIPACSGHRLLPAGGDSPSPIATIQQLDDVLAELDAVESPPGTDAALFDELKVELARVLSERFSSGKVATEPPRDDRSRAPLSWDEGSTALRWYYYSTGDYNQDGLVTVSDITPLGQNFDAEGPFDMATAVSCVDGDQNDFITIGDITPIGQCFGRQVSGYNVYGSSSASDYPAAASDGNGGATLLGSVEFSAAGGTVTDRKRFTFMLAEPQPELYCWVRPTDGSAEGTPSSRVQLPAAANIPPVASISADPQEGDVPLAVDFDASLSHDPDGLVVKYEWDWTGAGDGWQWVDTGATPTAQHTFENAGSFDTVVRVTDNLGATDTEYVTVTVTEEGNLPPVADLVGVPTTGDAPLMADFDATGSQDPDGTIVDYEWDLDGDGVYNGPTPEETLARGLPVASFTYTHGGNFTVKLRVTDNDGATAVDECTILLSGPVAEWHVYTVAASTEVYYPHLRNVNGRPGVVFYNHADDEVQFIRADDALGESWTDTPKVVCSDFEDWLVFVETDDNPAVIYHTASGLTFTRAVDPDGDVWGFLIHAADISVMLTTYGGAVIDGNPTVTYGTMSGPPDGYVYRRASAPDGISWADPTLVSSEVFGVMDLADINGAPGICYEDEDNGWCISYCWASDAAGTSWNSVTVDTTIVLAWFPSLIEVAGRPAILYKDFLPESVRPLYYIRADNATGSSWDSEHRVHIDSLQFLMTGDTIAVVDGRPAAAYAGGADNGLGLKNLYYKQALDSTGDAWPPATELVSEHACGQTDASLADIGGRPGIAFSTNAASQEGIHFAIYY